jgi:hypothetical protein
MKLKIMEKSNKNISAKEIEKPSGTPYYTWRKDKGFVVNGYIIEDKNERI